MNSLDLFAALRMPDGRLFTGRTHFEAMERLLEVVPGFPETLEDIAANPGLDSPEDGFATAAGLFLSREQAAELARARYPEALADIDELHTGDLERLAVGGG